VIQITLIIPPPLNRFIPEGMSVFYFAHRAIPDATTAAHAKMGFELGKASETFQKGRDPPWATGNFAAC
jgi:hypothetical protein